MRQYFKIQHPRLLPLGRLILVLPLFLLFDSPLYMNLFFVAIGIFSLWLAVQAGKEPEGLLSPRFLYRRIARFCLWAFMIIGLLQLIPVPVFALKLASPNTVKVLEAFQDSLPLLTTLSLAPADTLHHWMQVGGIVLCCGLIAYLQFGLDDVRELLKTVVISGLFLVICGGLFYFAANILSSNEADYLVPLRRRMTFYAAMCLPAAISILLSKMKYIGSRRGFVSKLRQAVKEDPLVWGYVAVPLVLLVFLLVNAEGSGFWAAFIPLAIYFLVLTYLRTAKPLRRKLRYVFVAVGFLFLLTGVFKALSSSVDHNSVGDITPGSWDIAGDITADFPILGTGWGTFASVARLYSFQYEGMPPTNAGGDFLEASAESGILATILLFGFFLTWLAGITRMWWARRHPDVKILGLAVLCALLVGLMHSLFQSSLHVPPQLFLMGLFMVLGIKTVTYKKHFPAD